MDRQSSKDAFPSYQPPFPRAHAGRLINHRTVLYPLTAVYDLPQSEERRPVGFGGNGWLSAGECLVSASAEPRVARFSRRSRCEQVTILTLLAKTYIGATSQRRTVKLERTPLQTPRAFPGIAR